MWSDSEDLSMIADMYQVCMYGMYDMYQVCMYDMYDMYQVQIKVITTIGRDDKLQV